MFIYILPLSATLGLAVNPGLLCPTPPPPPFSGICREGEQLVVGPTDSGQFQKLTGEGIQGNRSGCRVLRAGQAATLALGGFDRALLRKVRRRWDGALWVELL